MYDITFGLLHSNAARHICHLNKHYRHLLIAMIMSAAYIINSDIRVRGSFVRGT